MSTATSRRIGISLTLLIVFLQVAGLSLTLLNRATRATATQGPFDTVLGLTSIVVVLVFAVAGTLIVSRQPRNTIGWILIALPMTLTLANFVGGYATWALVVRKGTPPLGRFTAWLDRTSLVPTFCLGIFLFLLFPDGRLPSRRWRPALWLSIASLAVTTIAFAVTPGRMTGQFANLQSVDVTNPFGLDAAAGLVHLATVVGAVGCFVATFLAGASLVVRYRTRTGDERQQIRLLAFLGVAFLCELALFILLAVVLGTAVGETAAGQIAGDALFALMFLTLGLGIPIACAVSILRYRLYDLDIVVRKAVVVATVAVFVTAVYAIIVAGIGSAISGNGGSTKLSFVAAVALAILFQPARDRARRFADRLVYGKRATPYEVLAGLSEHVGDAYSTEDVLPRMARLLAEGTGATQARVSLRVGPDVVPVAAYPDHPDSQAGEGPAPDESGFPVEHLGETLGEVTVRMSPSDPLTPPKEQLIRDFASQAGHVLRNVQLVEDLKASRGRLVAAQDRERRTLERNIHDGAQQQLVALAVRAKLAGTLAAKAGAPRTEAMLDVVRTRTQAALESLREVARGIYPPLLADKGLPAALDAHARRSPVPVDVAWDGVGRYAQPVEATVYFCALEALQNVAAYANATRATVRLSASNGDLRFEVTDDGAGFDPATTGYGAGLQGMNDRLEALGGDLSIESAPGEGAKVVGHVPVGVEAPS
ncbi:MAG TPA: ATP-binding protein [Actinomycetota bacterium]|nr:ATP-binding protein [Actinomycetota bacterium]